MKAKKWSKIFVILFFAIILLSVISTIVIDPFFHYHKPFGFIKYGLSNERYINDGIIKHFNYDAIITGSSMTQNFKTSEMDKLFDCKSIKIPYSGACYKELNMAIETAVQNNPNIRYVVRCLDTTHLIQNADDMAYGSYPTYLYDDNPFNDISYLLNIETLYASARNVLKTVMGAENESFDTYSSWDASATYGEDAIKKVYIHRPKADEEKELTLEEKNIVKKNIEQNVLQIAKDNPNIEFYLYVSPYSIYKWDIRNSDGELNKILEAEALMVSMLIGQKNIKLYSFNNNYDLITNPDNYKDTVHYSGEINSQILKWMKNGEGLLTIDNYEDYLQQERDFYLNYDYESLFAQ